MASAHPRRAVNYFRGRNRRANATPAILWLFLLLVGIVTLRNGRIPDLSQSLTLALFAGLIVGAGLVLPELVTLMLVGLLIAAALRVPQVAPFLDSVQARVAALTNTRT